MKQIQLEQYALAAPLLQRIDHHTLIRNMLSGQTRGKVYVDQIPDQT